MLSYDEKRWLIGANRSDLWFDANPQRAFVCKVAAFGGTLLILVLCAAWFLEVLEKDFSDPTKRMVVAAMACIFIVGAVVCTILRRLEIRSAKYFRLSKYDGIRNGEFDGAQRRHVANSFELQAVLASALKADRRSLWNVRNHIDAMVEERRSNFLDTGLTVENREAELLRRESVIDRARTILMAASVSTEEIDLHMSELRQQVRYREKCFVEKARETAQNTIDEAEIDIARSLRLLKEYNTLSDLLQRER